MQFGGHWYRLWHRLGVVATTTRKARKRRFILENLEKHRIAILATNGFEQSELLEPRKRLSAAGAGVDVVSPSGGEIRGWKGGDWGTAVEVDRTLEDADLNDYDALLLPGGQINPDVLRANPDAVRFVRRFAESGKPVAAICHGPWLLIEADVLKGRKATSYHSIQTDMRNAGAHWIDKAVVVDGNIVTSRQPDDLTEFIDKVAEMTAQSGKKAVA